MSKIANKKRAITVQRAGVHGLDHKLRRKIPMRKFKGHLQKLALFSNIYEGNSASFEDKMEFRRQLLPK